MKRFLVPSIATVIFDLVSCMAICFRVYQTEGYFPPINEALFSRPICYFWVLWTGLVFFCVNGIAKEYRGLKFNAENSFPSMPKEDVRKAALIELGYTYSKKTLLLFAGLPIAYLATTDVSLTNIELKKILILLVPFLLDLTLMMLLKKPKASSSVKTM